MATKKKPAATEADRKAVFRLWKGGERLAALDLAEDAGVEDRPEGMAEFKAALKR